MIKRVWGPHSFGLEQRVCQDNELPHDGCDRDLWRSSGGDECGVFGFHVWVEAGGDERGHVKSASQFGAAAPDMAFSAMLPAIASDRCKTGQRRDLLAIEFDVPPFSSSGLNESLSGCVTTDEEEQTVKKSRYTEEQISYALRQAETGTPVAEVIRRMGVSEQTFYRWKKLYARLRVGELRRLKLLEEENRKLKQLVADLSLDKHILQDVLARMYGAPPSGKP